MALCLGALADGNEGNISAITITAPTANSYVKDSYTFTGTYTGNVSSGSINVTYNGTAVCGDTTGLTTQNGTWSCSGSLSSLVDAQCVAHDLNATAYNSTHVETNDGDANSGATSVYSDATAPTVTLAYTHSQIKSGEKAHYTCTATESCDSSPDYQVALTDPKSVISTNLTSASSYWTSSNTKEQGTYTSTCSATDNAGNVGTSSSATFRVSGTSSALVEDTSVGVVQEVSNKNKKVGLALLLLGIGVVTAFFIVLGIYFLVMRKK